MYILKQQPEDFRVKEISAIPCQEKGEYLYLILIKKNHNTIDAIKKIAQRLHIPEKNIGFAGSKDKNAITEQICSIKHGSWEKVRKIRIPNINLQFFGYGTTPISLGDHTGNYFEIVARNLDAEKITNIKWIENYFDEQRFSERNVQIGRHLIKKEFKEAVLLIDDAIAHSHLVSHNNDYIGALQRMPLRLLRLYVNAYQSYLWNETLARYLSQKADLLTTVAYSAGELVFVADPEKFLDLEIPLLGFSDSKSQAEVEKIIHNVMKKENITHHDFIIKQIPELSLEGELRKAFVEVKNVTIGRKMNDELNPGKKKVKVSFLLPKGSYATMVMKKMMQVKRS
ncbi:MAG: tRNA pseudouridine(13) synthase TruD [Nanoarchaeota archaeon]|nr:tRNA pseudouridine(13) synthase TruD [Nanoarchaeota archaeon]